MENKDEFGHDLNYYKYRFPIGKKFLKKSEYGTSILICQDIKITDNYTHHGNNGKLIHYSTYSIITYAKNDKNFPISYDVEECFPIMRKKKIERLLKDIEK